MIEGVTEPSQPDLARTAAVSARWASWRERTNIDEYDEHFDRLSTAGQNVHGEVDFIASYVPSSVLDAGCGTGRIAIELDQRGFDVSGVDLDVDMIDAARRKRPDMNWLVADLARVQLSRRYAMVVMPGNVMIFCEPDDRPLLVHNMAQHLEPGGLLIAGFTLESNGYALQQWDDHCIGCGLVLIERYGTWDREPFAEPGGYHVSVHRRSDRFSVHDLLAEARSGLTRMTPEQLSEALAADNDIVICDTRQIEDSHSSGFIEGSVHIARSVLEWRVDPASGYTHPAIIRLDQRLVVVCNDGYSSSLAAATLQKLGYHNATDLVGGFNAWLRAGLPVVGGPDVR